MFNAALRDLEGARTIDEVWRITIAALDAKGVTAATYLTVGTDFTNPFLRTTLPQLYEVYDPSSDPFLHHCCGNYEITRTGAAYLGDYPYLPKAAQRFIREASRSGFVSGMGIPVRLIEANRFGGLNIGTRYDRATFEERTFPHAENFRLLALVLHRKVEELSNQAGRGNAVQGEAILDIPPMPALSALSPREAEIIWLLAKGLTRKEIARSCALSPHTVADYTRSAYRKLGVKNRVQAARIALGA